MKYRADYLADTTTGRWSTQTILADSDKAAHELALISAPENMALVSVYRVELRQDDLYRMQCAAFDDKTDATPGELIEMLGLLLHAWDEGERVNMELHKECDFLSRGILELYHGEVITISRARELMGFNHIYPVREMYRRLKPEFDLEFGDMGYAATPTDPGSADESKP